MTPGSSWSGRAVGSARKVVGEVDRPAGLDWSGGGGKKEAAVGQLGGLLCAHAGGPSSSVAAAAAGPSEPCWLKGPFVFLVF
jgi:hypothetical protein